MSEPDLFHESSGTGPTMVLLHGLTAVGTQVVHGSHRLERAGHRVVTYDARSHGDSAAPPTDIPMQEAYSYEALASDLGRIVEITVPDREDFWLAGSSMGAHTIARYALDQPDRIAGLVLIGPAYAGGDPDAADLAVWNALSEGLRNEGGEGFVRAYEESLRTTDDWRERLVALARDRIGLHSDHRALADALQWIPRSRPFQEVEELGSLEMPALVIGSDDSADPGHPLAVAEAWSAAIPAAELHRDEPGATPTAWSGGRLSGLIADFAALHA